MKRVLRLIALLVTLAAGLTWLSTGAHRGWTQTSVPKKSIEEVTGLESITYEKRFVMGVDLLGCAWLGAGVLAGASFLFRNNKHQSIQVK